MDYLSNLEVKITKKNNCFEVESTLIPNTIGRGETLEIALKQLSKKIVKKLSTELENKFSSMFEKENYTEVLFDNSDEQNFKQKRIYSLDNNEAGMYKSLFTVLKISNLQNKREQAKKNEALEQLFNQNTQFFSSPKTSDIDEDESLNDGVVQTLQKLIQNEKGSIAFGFPMSFN